jgi:hypothetical protein
MPTMLEDAMRSAIQTRGESLSRKQSLTIQDIFYRKVSAFSSIIAPIIDYEAHQLSLNGATNERIDIIMQVNTFQFAIIDNIISGMRNITYYYSCNRKISKKYKKHLKSKVDMDI